MSQQPKITRPATYRFWRIHQVIKAGRYPNVPSLARELEVSRRTIERDLAYLRDLFGAPIQFDHKHGGYIYTEPTFQLPPLELSEGEVAALLVASRMLSMYGDTPIAPVVHRVLNRIIELLPNRVLIDTSDLEQSVGFAPAQLPANAGDVANHFDEIMEAISRHRRLKIRYYSASRQQELERIIDPYTLYHAAGTWYVIGYCHVRKEILLFALHRIGRVEHIGDAFTVPTDYNPVDYMGNAWQAFRDENTIDVMLQFAPALATFIAERQWHPTQRLETLQDGSLLMHVSVAGTAEILTWILGWGANCRVLSPESLRTAVIDQVGALQNLYSTPPVQTSITETSTIAN